MIGKLTGIIDSIEANTIILDVNGVGYVVSASGRTLSQMGSQNDKVSLLITTQVREDAITLYGFANQIEQGWFKLLTSVQGVGAKAGLAILSACPADQIGFAIAAQDKTALTRADGVGPKLATRILTELKDKVGSIEMTTAPTKTSSTTATTDTSTANRGVEQDAVSALTNLGYASADAFRAVSMAKTKTEEQDNLQSLIRLALQELSS